MTVGDLASRAPLICSRVRVSLNRLYSDFYSQVCGYSTPQEVVLMAKPRDKTIVAPTTVWQKWAKGRAQNAPSLERVHEISKKVKVNVTQLLLEERRDE